MADPRFLHNTFSCPNFLVDEVMPSLRDTEWRLLCVIVRQTRGWMDEASGERKVWDWLSQSQLKKRTGRNTGALSKALDVLVRRGLVLVQDATGRRLTTPQQRRRANGPLFYALGPAGIGSTEIGSTPPSFNSALFQQPTLQSRAKPEKKASTVAGAKLSTPKSAARKTHTTKETDTKINTKDDEKRSAVERHEFKLHETKSNLLTGAQAALTIDSDPVVMRFVQTYEEQYRERRDTSAPSALPGDIQQLIAISNGIEPQQE